MHWLKLLTPFLFLSSWLPAQESQLTQTIRGEIMDKHTQSPLPGATILLLGSDPPKGTTTDQDGSFRLENVPVGRVGLRVSFVGYESITLRNLLLKSGKELILNIGLEENIQELGEVIIRGRRKDRPGNEMAKVSARSFTVEETEKYAGSWGDPSRMAANYAGVISAGDQRNDIIIRGNPPIGLLWRMEGVNIPNPNHFGALGATGGPISMLNNNLLTNSDFFTGAFPAEYGNALSGVFDLKMRNGNNEKREYTGQVGFNGFELGAEGPFSDSSKASYLANYRYSTLAVMNELGINLSVGAVPEYQDLSFKLNVPTQKGRISLFGLGGTSHIDLGQERDSSAHTYDAPKGYRTRNGSDMAVAGLSHLHFFNENTRIKNSLSVSGTRVTTKIDSLYEDGPKKLVYHENNRQWKMGFYSKMVKKIDVQNTVDFGFSLENQSIHYLDSVFQGYDRQPEQPEYITQTNSKKQNLLLYQGYGQWEHRFTDDFSIYTGLHGQYFAFNKTWGLEPRFNMEWDFKDNQSLSLGYGKHAQLQPLFLYLIQTHISNRQYIQTNNDLNFTRSNQYVLSYDYSLSENLRLKTETYYQNQYDIPVEQKNSHFSLANYGASFHLTRVDSLVNQGTSRNYGLELTLEKFLSKNYYFLITASLFDSKYKGSDGIQRNTAFNNSYVINALGGYEIPLGKQNTLSIDLRMTTAGGKRYTPIDLDTSREQDQTVYKETLAFEEQYKPYFRMDGRLSFKQNKKHFTQEWALDITNITDHKNTFSTSYDPNQERVVTEYQQSFFPVMLYRINF
ncbi:MAG: TonB-dependent receptor [Bacteroidota bacterium]